MGKQSTRENKTFYQICREEAGLTRSDASEKMTAVSDLNMKCRSQRHMISFRWPMLIKDRIFAIIIALINVK